MTISELVTILERAMDEHGDLPVEVKGGVEAFGLKCIFETGKKEPEVIAVQVT